MKSISLAAIVLWPLSFLYSLIMRLRAWFYLVGVFPSEPSGAFVVSVGNVQVGGTGKTPFVVMLANRWKQKVRLGVVSRGYGRDTSGVLAVDAKNPEAAIRFGDEPVLMAEKSAVPVYVGESRVEAARELIAAEGTRLIILDDGFQHLKLRRSFDILLVDVSAPDWHWHVLPAGRLREPLSAFERADLVVLTKVESASPARVQEIKARLRECLDRFEKRQVPIVCFRQEIAVPSALSGARVFLVAGLARPSNFFELVRTHLTGVVGELAFRDHHDYSAIDVEAIKTAAMKNQASAVLTTEKDAVKLKAIWYSVGPSISLEVAQLNLVPQSEEDKVGMERIDAIILDQTRLLSHSNRR